MSTKPHQNQPSTVQDLNRAICQSHDWLESMQQGKPTQQASAYFWEQVVFAEENHMSHGSLGQHEAQSLVDRVLASFNIATKVPVTYRSDLGEGREGRTIQNTRTKEQFIELAPQWASSYTVLHECSHVLLNAKGFYESENHGPEYIRVFCELMYRFKGLDLKKSIASAKRVGLAVDTHLPFGLQFHETTLKEVA